MNLLQNFSTTNFKAYISASSETVHVIKGQQPNLNHDKEHW